MSKLLSQLLKGTYSGATSYTVGDIVDYAGSSYACKVNSTNNLPTDTTYWAVLASKGDTGATGATGAQGPQGEQGPSGTGTVNGPASSTSSNIAVFSNSTGTIIADSGYKVSDLVDKASFSTQHSVLVGAGSGTYIQVISSQNSVLGRTTGSITSIFIDADLSSVSSSDDTVPSAKATKTALDLKANLADPSFTGTLTAVRVKLTEGASAGKVLTSDADGDATWETSSGGGAVRSVGMKLDTGAYSSTATSLTEISTNWRLPFTPVATTSTLIFQAKFSVNNSNSEIRLFDFYDVTNATAVGSGVAAGSRRAANTSFRGPGTDNNDAEHITMMAIVPNSNTTPRTYTVRMTTETTGTGTTYINQSNGDSAVFGWNTPFTFTIMEI